MEQTRYTLKNEKLLPKRLSELMQCEKKSLKDLADFLGVSPQAVSNYKNGVDKIDTDKLISIAKYFNVSADYLLGITDFKTPELNFRAFCEATELSESALEILLKMTEHKNTLSMDLTKTLDRLLTSNSFFPFIRTLQIYFGCIKNPVHLDITDNIKNEVISQIFSNPQTFEDAAFASIQKELILLLESEATKIRTEQKNG